MTETFTDKVAFISGAASGLGFATAKAFAEAGAAVALTDLNEAAAQAAAETLTQAGHRAIGIGCDVTNEQAVEAAVARTVAELGGLHIAYNNAGLHVPSVETADALAADFDLAIAVNLRISPRNQRKWINCSRFKLYHPVLGNSLGKLRMH